MHKKKIQVSKAAHRVLLTELLPFELAPNIDSRGFFELISRTGAKVTKENTSWTRRQSDSPSTADDLLVQIIVGTHEHDIKLEGKTFEILPTSSSTSSSKTVHGSWRHPLTFLVDRPDGQYRALTIPHPKDQLASVEFLENYSDAIVHQARKSKFSLRAPVAKSQFVYVDDKTFTRSQTDRTHGIELSHEGYISFVSFFRYSSFSNINKFFASADLHSLETKYRHQRRLDITRCFESIYTHSVDWAFRGRAASKNFMSDATLGNDFDSLLRNANNGQTNGILIGSELSRVFAELILQRVDRTVEKNLENRGLKFSEGYVVARYVDDYFIFSHSLEVQDEIQHVLEIELGQYNLRFNKAKQQDLVSMSRSMIHYAKLQIAKDLTKYLKKARSFVEGENGNGSTPKVKRAITSFKRAISVYGVDAARTTGYALSIIERKSASIIKRIDLRDRAGQERAAAALSDICTLAHAIYASSPSVSAAVRLSRVMIRAVESAQKMPIDVQNVVLANIDRVCRQVIGAATAVGKHRRSVETQYLLLVHARLGSAYIFTSDELSSILRLDPEVGGDDPDYFDIIASLTYMQRRKRFEELRIEVCKIVTGRIAELELRAAERAMLLADVIACRHIPSEQRAQWLAQEFQDLNASQISTAIAQWPKRVFTSWAGFDLDRALHRKQALEVY
ncbi:antiviral reverse transcriptase Drt3b [Mycetocola tolaasinivorans]|uniref:antiviral reverse transcriptase Drt3b n=1 Tax=Mycetocola tolaasinivorans TaxID=76635 RepID=UPI0016041CA1|nr:antiviral reverse transcriptase Drt3b [Mycetocola tolaasinivorans]